MRMDFQGELSVLKCRWMKVKEKQRHTMFRKAKNKSRKIKQNKSQGSCQDSEEGRVRVSDRRG